MLKNKQRQASSETAQHDVPTEVSETSAAVSEEAACCVADIDDVLADLDEAVESEEDKAQRERDELVARYNNCDITYTQYVQEWRALRAKYAHLDIWGCTC